MTRTPHRSIRLPDDWWAAIEAEAEKAGIPVSEWIVDAIREQLPKKARARLSKPKGRGRPKKGE